MEICLQSVLFLLDDTVEVWETRATDYDDVVPVIVRSGDKPGFPADEDNYLDALQD